MKLRFTQLIVNKKVKTLYLTMVLYYGIVYHIQKNFLEIFSPFTAKI